MGPEKTNSPTKIFLCFLIVGAMSANKSTSGSVSSNDGDWDEAILLAFRDSASNTGLKCEATYTVNHSLSKH